MLYPTITMYLFVTLLLILPAIVNAYEMSVSGFVSAEVRGFLSDAQFPDQFNGLQSSIIFQPELELVSANGNNQFSFIPFVRLDDKDNRRTHGDIREAYWLYLSDHWEVLMGINRVFWGVTESRHLVDIINQTDFVEDVDNEDKLGQPMFNFSVQQDWGALSFYVLPLFRKQTFPSKEGRLRPPLVVDNDVVYESAAGQHHIDVAMRYAHYIDAWDFGLYYFKGTGREPRLIPDQQGAQLIAHYDQIDQAGVDVQFTNDAWLWKFEGILRNQNNEHITALVGGFEYTLYQVKDTTWDIGLLTEYLYDDRNTNPQLAPATIFNDDVFIGTRLALNDVQDSQLLLGFVIDQDDGSTLLTIEVERRLNNHWNFELESRWFLNVEKINVLSAFKDDDFVTLRLSRYF